MGCLKLDYYSDYELRAHERTRSGEANMVLYLLSPDALSEEFPDCSTYVYASNDPILHTDPDGNARADIVILGASNSSVTLKTNLIDIKVNASSLSVDFGGNDSLSGNDVLSAGLDIVGILNLR